MLTAKEAREKINIDNSLTLKSVEQKIEQAIEKATTDLKTNVTVYLVKYLPFIGQQQIIDKLQKLGYIVEYNSYSSALSTNSSESFYIEW